MKNWKIDEASTAWMSFGAVGYRPYFKSQSSSCSSGTANLDWRGSNCMQATHVHSPQLPRKVDRTCISMNVNCSAEFTFWHNVPSRLGLSDRSKSCMSWQRLRPPCRCQTTDNQRSSHSIVGMFHLILAKITFWPRRCCPVTPKNPKLGLTFETD